MFSDQDRSFMEMALDEAQLSFNDNEVPVGAIIVKDNEVIGSGHNQVIHTNNVTSHAEINAIIDASYKSIKSKKWEKINLDIWRGREGVSKINTLESYDENYYLVKEEMTHYGDKKLILKSKKDGKIIEKVVKE